jgi:antirestriction protein ArdC
MKPCTVNDNAQDDQSPKQDIYARITAKIVAALEGGVWPWVRPWNAAHAAGRISRPLRYNGQPYAGINVLALWTSASVQGFAAPIWMTYRQAVELDAHVRKGEKGSSVVYANSITRTETDTDSGVDVARDIHFLRGYTVFNVEQIDGLPVHYTAPASPHLDVSARIVRAERFFGATGATIAHGGNRAFTGPRPTASCCHSSRLSATPRATTPLSRTRRRTGPHTNRAWRATSAPRVSGPKATRSKNSWRNSAPRSSVPILI